MKARSLAAISLLALLAAWAWLRRESAPRGGDDVVEASPAAPAAGAAAAAAAEISPASPGIRQPETDAASDVAQPAAPVAAEAHAGALVEVRVLFDEQPVSGATVRIVPFDASSGFLIGSDPPSVLAKSTSDTDGLARFERCAPGDYGVAAASAGGAAATAGVEARSRFLVTPDANLVHLVLPLGSAALQGEVHDLDGRASSGTIVLARQDSRPGESSAWFATKTDARGSYRLGGLGAGAGRRLYATVLDLPLGESTPFELAPGETRRLDFGSTAGRASWAGTVRFPSGAICAGFERLCFTAAAGSTEVLGYFDERGGFRAVLPAGSYVAHLGGPGGIVLGKAAVEGAVEQDLTLPKVVLRGRIRYVGAKHPIPKGPENDVLLTLERDPSVKIERGPLRGPSTYIFCGLEPGTYAVTTSPWTVAGSADGRATIQIGAGTEEMELDLSITDP